MHEYSGSEIPLLTLIIQEIISITKVPSSRQSLLSQQILFCHSNTSNTTLNELSAHQRTLIYTLCEETPLAELNMSGQVLSEVMSSHLIGDVMTLENVFRICEEPYHELPLKAKEGLTIGNRVSGIIPLEESRIVRLITKEQPWHVAFQRLNIEYGHANGMYQTRNSSALHRRDTPSATTLNWQATSIIPTSTPTSTSATLNLTHQQADTTFSFPFGLGPSAPLVIGCKLCQTTGSATLSHGTFNISLSGGDVTSPLSYLKNGTIQLQLDGFSAHIELQITPELQGNMNYSLFSVPIFGFEVRPSCH